MTEQLKRLRKMARERGLILRRERPREDSVPAGYELVFRERELAGGAMDLKTIETMIHEWDPE
jgi:hypothetical protein